MSRRIASLAAAAAVLCAAGCGAGTMTVRAEPISYSPAMSSTPGIGLTPVFAAPAGTTYGYYWHASFGYFLSWAPPSYKVVPLGVDAVSGSGALYWSYDPKLTFVNKPVVTISVEARDRESGRVMARRTLKLDWEQDTARVREE
jgi:hypothetical protein